MTIPETLSFLNQIYRPLEACRSSLAQLLRQNGFSLSSGYFNGHYSKDAGGNYIRDDYPIPVLTVGGLCDLELGLTGVSVSTKLLRTQALCYDYSRLAPFSFEIYGVQDYLRDLYTPGDSLDHLRENLLASPENEIGFSFAFPPSPEPQMLLEFLLFLHAEGFFY